MRYLQRLLVSPACTSSSVRALASVAKVVSPLAAPQHNLHSSEVSKDAASASVVDSRDDPASTSITIARGINCESEEPMRLVNVASSASTSLGPRFSEARGSFYSFCYICGEEGHKARACPKLTQKEVPEMICPCGAGVCPVFIATTAKNLGRLFYKCPLAKRGEGCTFFLWCDEYLPHAASIKGDPNGNCQGAPTCPCGAGVCIRLTAKTERNKGRAFYRCPLGQEGCRFFAWCDSITHGPISNAGLFAAPSVNQNGNPKAFSGTVSSSSGREDSQHCFNCGNNGHWAKECPTTRPKTQEHCYICGMTGHWARDCPQERPRIQNKIF